MKDGTSFLAYLSGVSTSVAGALTLQEVALICGIITSLGTWGVNWYYKAAERRDAQKARQGVCDAE